MILTSFATLALFLSSACRAYRSEAEEAEAGFTPALYVLPLAKRQGGGAWGSAPFK